MSELWRDLEEAARFGAEGSSVTRLAWSPELLAVYDWLAGRARQLGLEAERDAAGNLRCRWEGGSAKAVVVGSHLDTVPHGGRFDGALGVLGGLHAIRLLKERGIVPERPIWLVSFMDEEGARFGTALFGSRAFVGDDLAMLAHRRDDGGVALSDAVASAGFSYDGVIEARRVEEVEAYLELHVEQGPVLENAGVDIGIATEIVGLIGYRARFLGEANHAGTTPMELRRDTLAGAARVVLALRDTARSREGLTANVGVIGVEPGGSNVVPGACEFTIDVRSPRPEELRWVDSFVHDALGRIAQEEQLALELRETYRLEPTPLDAGLVELLERAAADEGARSLRLPSGAGHDAMVLAPRVPTGLLFVPSRGGISHSPDEYTRPESCEVGARVLARTLERLVA